MVSEKLEQLWQGEEELRVKAKDVILASEDLQLHIRIIEKTMDLADVFRRVGSDEEDVKVLRVLGMRAFNGFASSLKLALGGYSQNAAMILRDLLETAFLLDYFRSFPEKISLWRNADEKSRLKSFRPIDIRIALDERDDLHNKKRAEKYALFSQIAGHPTMKSDWMLRPDKDGDAHIGPFVTEASVTAIIEEAGMLAAQIGTFLCFQLPKNNAEAMSILREFHWASKEWHRRFFR
ncbi:hypothetical protein [uncultured Maritimibacter sp.]|uniref:hypothetical protein n=1 Tax=uncultured Maritimibacter sp. TaxID=991866 RepID=UPI00259A5972|nr:hypothetical protein [uncultured Maritimibacter sp.]